MFSLLLPRERTETKWISGNHSPDFDGEAMIDSVLCVLDMCRARLRDNAEDRLDSLLE